MADERISLVRRFFFIPVHRFARVMLLVGDKRYVRDLQKGEREVVENAAGYGVLLTVFMIENQMSLQKCG